MISMLNKSLLLKLFEIAFRTRFCLPLLISAGFMVLDYQLTIEVEVEANARANNNNNGNNNQANLE